MTEKPREYKKRIDDTRAKMRENRDELIDYIDEYELVDEKYKAETKQEILASFDKNEKAEKSSELYIKIGEELLNIEQKYKELEELKEKLEAKRNERETLKNELKVQNIDGDDKTTLKMQMQKIKSINSKIEEIDVESKELEKRIEEREKEIKEIEETYGKKEDTGEISIKEEKEQGITNPQEETTKKGNSRTLQEYKETVLFEKLRIGSIRGKIIELLEEGTGIDEILKEEIKGKISDVFEKYNDEISGSLRMKSAEYMEDRDAILNLDTAFRIKSINGKKCFMLGKEQYSGWFDEYNYASLKMEELKIKSKYENITETSREKREKIILERYQKKLNRDELLKIISGIETMDDNGKKALKSEILSDFIVELKKAISTEGFKELDKEYRELKKSERQKTKKLAELETQVEISRPEVVQLDEKLVEIANSAMNLEDDSRLKIIKSKKLGKAKEEWNILESRLNEILDKVKEMDKEEVELISIYSEKEKKYGKKSERPKIKGKTLNKDTVAIEKLEGESTLLGHKKAYMELANDKEKYIDDLLKEIETTDFGISNEKKKDVMEKLKTALEKELETFKEGDDITKLADETEKWLKENWKSVMEQIEGLNRKIQEKEKEIKRLRSKGTGDDSKKIYKAKQREFGLRDELLDLKDQFESLKTKFDEKLKNYDGTVIDWTKGITIETWEERWAIPFIQIGINPKDLTVHGELLNKPIYIYKDSDGSFILFRGYEEIRSGITEIIEIKNIGGDIVLKTKNSDGYYSVFRGDKECYGSRRGKKDKYKEIYDIHEVDGKPIFLALDSDGYYSIIIGDEKYEGDKNYRGNLAEGYYEKEIKEDLEKKQYTNITQGYKIIGWEK